MTYDVAEPGEWIQPVRRNYFLRCCDCSLVHRMNFRLREGHIEFQVFRAERSTAACRRKRKKKGH